MNDAAPQTEPIEEQPDLSDNSETSTGQTPEIDLLDEAPTRREVIDWLNSMRSDLRVQATRDQTRLDQIRSEALTFSLNANAGGTAGVGNTEVIEHAERYFAFLSGTSNDKATS
jgi:hypothetical protein